MIPESLTSEADRRERGGEADRETQRGRGRRQRERKKERKRGKKDSLSSVLGAGMMAQRERAERERERLTVVCVRHRQDGREREMVQRERERETHCRPYSERTGWHCVFSSPPPRYSRSCRSSAESRPPASAQRSQSPSWLHQGLTYCLPIVPRISGTWFWTFGSNWLIISDCWRGGRTAMGGGGLKIITPGNTSVGEGVTD